MAVSLVTWYRVISACIVVISSSQGLSVVGFEVGGDPIARNKVDTRQNTTTIVNQKPIQAAGLVTRIESYMLNSVDCVRLQVWRPAAPYRGHGGSTLPPPTLRPTVPGISYVTPVYRPAPVSYWVMVGQSAKCLNGEIGNQTFIYDFHTDNHIRVERGDVLGFSARISNPVPYTIDSTNCANWDQSLTLQSELHPDHLKTHIAFGFVPLNECRTYSIKAVMKQSECRIILPVGFAQNLTYTSYGRESEDICWILAPAIPSISNKTPTILYLRYRVLTLSSCDVGSVEVREGRSSTSSLIQKDCQMPDDLNAELRPITTGAVYVRFRRKAGVGGTVNLIMQYSTERVIESSCRDIQVDENQVLIGSPNYPHHYPPNANICWRLEAKDRDSRVRVELGRGLDLQPPVGCEPGSMYNTCQERHCKDFIEVRDGTSRKSPLMVKWCDHNGEDLIETSSQYSMSVYFIADDMIQGSGFQIKVYAVHPETVQCTHYVALYVPGSVQSPFYPYMYPDNRDDCWSVRANDKDLRLLVSVKDSSIENDAVCAKDWIEVRDGPGRSAPLLRRWCGTTIPDPILTTGPYLYVRFVSNSMGRYAGFSLAYQQVDSGMESDACTVYYAYPHREYLKPDFGQTDPGYAIRCFIIRSEIGKIRLHWDSLKNISHPITMCGNTFIQVYNGESYGVGGTQYCENNPFPPNGIESTGNSVYIRWVSDVNSRPTNFRLAYMSLATTHCPLVFATGESPVFLSNPLPGMTTTVPSFYYNRGTTASTASNRPAPIGECPSCKYGPNQQVCWTVETDRPNGHLRVNVRFVELQGRDHRGQCKYDFLELRDGQSGDAPLVANLCGSMDPTNLTTTSRWLFVRFQSDHEIEKRGFRLEVNAIYDNNCTIVQAHNYLNPLHSPYPSVYAPGTHKCWIIKSPSNQQPIKVRAVTITLDIDDAIEFYDSDSSEAGSLIQMFDHTTKSGAQVISTANVMTIVLRTGGQTTSRGKFDLRYNWVYAGLCQYIPITDVPTYISTRGYGGRNYTSNDYLCWVLTVLDPTHLVEIHAEEFMLEEVSRCSADYLDIYDGPKASEDTFLHKYCGSITNKVLARSSGRSLYVVFASDSKNQYPGFLLRVFSRTKEGGSSGGLGGGLNTTVLIIAPVIAAVVIVLVVLIFFVCWSRTRASAAATSANANPAPVVVYTNQPPAYTAPIENGAAGHTIVEDNKLPLPDDSVETESLPPPTPTGTRDSATLL